MPSETDRTLIKKYEKGVYGTIASISNVDVEVQRMHSRTQPFLKTGSENAATNVAEAPAIMVQRKSRLRGFVIMSSTNVASDNTDYVVIKFYKRYANGGSKTLVGSWNTHGGAQGALTELTANVVTTSANGLVTNSDGEIAASSFITYEILKYGAGKAVGQNSIFSFGLEEV